MRCLRNRWMRNCLSLSVLLLASPSQCTPEQVDSYCALYTQMLHDDKDAAAAVKLPLAFKKRLLANEKLYRDVCPQAKAA